MRPSARVRALSFAFVAVFALSAVREPPARAEPVQSTSEAAAAARERRAKRLEHAGVWVTAIGIVHVGVGLPLLAVGLRTDACHGDACSDAPLFWLAPAFGILGVGVTLLAVGLPLWIVGHRRHPRTAATTTPSSPDPGIVMRF